MLPVETQTAAPQLVTVEESAATTNLSDRSGIRLAAALISAMLPGAGQWLVGASLNAMFLHLAFASLVVAYWFSDLPRSYAGLVGGLVAGWVLFCLSTWDALRNSRQVIRPKSPIWLAVFLPIAVLASTAFSNYAVRANGFRTYGIPSESMEQTLDIGDRLIVDTHYFAAHVVRSGDVIIFHKDGRQFCKRVIATGGSQVEGINNVIYVGGERLHESYVQHTGKPPDYMTNFGPMLVPAGSLFVMGDNRDHSLDSRDAEFGFIPESSLVGKPLYIYYSERAERHGRKIE
jgi:signal peptidase I